MTSVQNEPATRPPAPRALTAVARRLTAARMAALDGAVLQERPSRAPPPSVTLANHLYCGWCHGTMDDVGVHHVARCARCGRNVSVPSYITIVCERCGHSVRVQPRRLGSERRCAVCGNGLKAGDLVLAPYRHRRHHRSHYTSASPYGDAAWAMLIVGLTLLVLVLSLTVL